jgi:hypothetical protein
MRAASLDHFFDDRPKVAILLLETLLILGEEAVKIVKKHPVEDSPLRMSGTIDSCHSRGLKSRNGPIVFEKRESLKRQKLACRPPGPGAQGVNFR